jgi:hypothetical protein
MGKCRKGREERGRNSLKPTEPQNPTKGETVMTTINFSQLINPSLPQEAEAYRQKLWELLKTSEAARQELIEMTEYIYTYRCITLDDIAKLVSPGVLKVLDSATTWIGEAGYDYEWAGLKVQPIICQPIQ